MCAAYFRVPSIDRINSVVSLLSYAVQVVMLGSYHHHLLHHAMPCHATPCKCIESLTPHTTLCKKPSLSKRQNTKSMTNPTRSSINISNRRPSSSSLDFHHRQSLLVIVNRLNGSTDSTSFHRSGHDGFAFEAQNVHAVSDPVAGAVSEDDDEAHEGYYVGDASGGRIGDGALDWGELERRVSM